MITRQEVLGVAKDLNIETTEEQILFVIRYYYDQADADPTGYWAVWVEDLLGNFDVGDLDEPYYGQEIDNVFKHLVSEYADSDVVSGEFIHTAIIPNYLNGEEVNEYHVIKGIQAFLDWDDSEETFRVIYCNMEKEWSVTYPFSAYDSIEYDGKEYPVRTFNVEVIGHDYEGTYMIAPESLHEAIESDEDEDGERSDEGEEVDNQIYHYVEDAVFFSNAKEICAKHLDLPMKFISEITYSI